VDITVNGHDLEAGDVVLSLTPHVDGDTAATPVVTYSADTGTTADGVVPANRQPNQTLTSEQAGRGVPLTPVDTAGPVMLSAITSDTDADGRLDAIVLTYSEIVDSVAASGAGYAVADGGYPYSVTAAVALDNTVTLTVDPRETTDTGVTPTITYAAAAGDTFDGVDPANESPNQILGSADRARPVMMSAYTSDTDAPGTDGHGQIDRIVITYSENLAPVLAGGGAYAVDGYQVTGAVRGDGTTFSLAQVVLTLDEIGPDTDAVPVITYSATPGGTTDGINLQADATSPLAATEDRTGGAMP